MYEKCELKELQQYKKVEMMFGNLLTSSMRDQPIQQYGKYYIIADSSGGQKHGFK